MLPADAVSREANQYFCPIENYVCRKSFVSFFRMFVGPGKRGSLSPQKAAKSMIVCETEEQSNSQFLGYESLGKTHMPPQFVVPPAGKAYFIAGECYHKNCESEVLKLKERLAAMNEKYVFVPMKHDDGNVYITYFDDKIHVGSYARLPEDEVKKIAKIFKNDIGIGDKREDEIQPTAHFDLTVDDSKTLTIAAKTAINTLAFLKGHDYITQTNDFRNIILQIMTKENSKIYEYVTVVRLEQLPVLREKFSLTDDQHFCLINEVNNSLRALVCFYDIAFEVILCKNLSSPSDIHNDGIVCCWKQRKDYRYSDYISQIK